MPSVCILVAQSLRLSRASRSVMMKLASLRLPSRDVKVVPRCVTGTFRKATLGLLLWLGSSGGDAILFKPDGAQTQRWDISARLPVIMSSTIMAHPMCSRAGPAAFPTLSTVFTCPSNRVQDLVPS